MTTCLGRFVLCDNVFREQMKKNKILLEKLCVWSYQTKKGAA